MEDKGLFIVHVYCHDWCWPGDTMGQGIGIILTWFFQYILVSVPQRLIKEHWCPNYDDQYHKQSYWVIWKHDHTCFLQSKESTVLFVNYISPNKNNDLLVFISYTRHNTSIHLFDTGNYDIFHRNNIFFISKLDSRDVHPSVANGTGPHGEYKLKLSKINGCFSEYISALICQDLLFS